MMTSSMVESVKELLLNKYSVKIPSVEWLEQCVEFAVDAASQRPTADVVTEEVLGQLLDFDLHEMGEPTLPAHVANCRKAVVKGPFLCQVQALADVSKPFYRQYQELTRTYCRDSEVGTNDPEEHNGDMNPTQTQSHTQSHSHRSRHSSTGYQRQENGRRCLMLQLTDGVRTVKGMEYLPNPSLDPLNIQPGCKVVLLNKILCRKGVMLLRPENIRVLGGKVDSLIPIRTPLYMFASVLGKEDHLRKLLGNLSVGNTQSSSLTSTANSSQQSSSSVGPNPAVQPFQMQAQRSAVGPISYWSVPSRLVSPVSSSNSHTPTTTNIQSTSSVTSLTSTSSNNAQTTSRRINIVSNQSTNAVAPRSNPAASNGSSASIRAQSGNHGWADVGVQNNRVPQRNYEVVTLPTREANARNNIQFGLSHVNLIENDDDSGVPNDDEIDDLLEDDQQTNEVLQESLNDEDFAIPVGESEEASSRPTEVSPTTEEPTNSAAPTRDDIVHEPVALPSELNIVVPEPKTPGREIVAERTTTSEGTSNIVEQTEERIKPKFTSTPFTKTVREGQSASGVQIRSSMDFGLNTITIANKSHSNSVLRRDLGECVLADLKTCQFGPSEIQMSYTAQVKCGVESALSELRNESGQMWTLTIRLRDSSATLDVKIASQVLEEIIGLSPLQVFECQSFIEEGSNEADKIKEGIKKVPQMLQQPELSMRIVYEHKINEGGVSSNEKQWPIVTRLHST